MHEIQRDRTIFSSRECDTNGCIISGFSLFFNIFFYAPFNKFNKMFFTEMRSAVPDEGYRRFLTFQALNGHEKPLEAK
jgi:hypothetical protein